MRIKPLQTIHTMTMNRIAGLPPAWSRVVVNVIATMLSACATAPQFKLPDVPAADGYDQSATQSTTGVTTPTDASPIDVQTFATNAGLETAWWQQFKSPQLDRLMQQALQNNHTLAAAQATAEQAQALAEASTGVRYPQLDLTASSGRQRYGSEFLGSIAPPPTFTYFAFGPAVSYTLDFNHALANTIKRQQAIGVYQQRQLQAAQLSVTGNLMLQAVAMASSQSEIDTIDDLLMDDRRNLELVEAAFEAGSVSRVDVLSAHSQLANDQTLLPALQLQLSVARHAMSVLLGAAPGTVAIPEFKLNDFSLPQQLLLKLPAELLHGRPDIMAAEAQLQAATAAVGIATANLYPRITLTGSLSQQALHADELFNASNRAWGLIAGLTAPVFDGGRLRAEQRAAIAALSAQAATYQQTVIQSFAQVADTLDALHRGTEQLAAQAEAVHVAQQNIDLTRDSYREGNVGILQVLDSERAYHQARLGYVRAEAQRLRDSAQLFVAMGGNATAKPANLANK